MVRTASSDVRVSGGKSNRKGAASGGSSSRTLASSSSSEKASGGGGGNPVCPREIPSWQQPIANFFHKKVAKTENTKDSCSNNDNNNYNLGAGSSKDAPCKSDEKMNIAENQEGCTESHSNSDNNNYDLGAGSSKDVQCESDEKVNIAENQEGVSENHKRVAESEEGASLSADVIEKSNVPSSVDKNNTSETNDDEKERPPKKIKYDEFCKNIDALETGNMFV